MLRERKLLINNIFFWYRSLAACLTERPTMSLHFHTSLKRTSSLLEGSPVFDASGKYVIFPNHWFFLSFSSSLFLIAVCPIYSNFSSHSPLLFLFFSSDIFFFLQENSPSSAQMALRCSIQRGVHLDVRTHTHTYSRIYYMYTHLWREEGKGKKKGEKPCVVGSARD